MGNHVEEEGDAVEENEEERMQAESLRWESSRRVKEAAETHREEEEGRREVLTGKSLGVIAEDEFVGVIAEDEFVGAIAEDSDSAVHLDYSSDSLRSEQGRCERGDCGRGLHERGQRKKGQHDRGIDERGQFERGPHKRGEPCQISSETLMERLPSAVTRGSEGQGGRLFDRSTPVLHPAGCFFDNRSVQALNPAGSLFDKRVTPVLKQRGLGLQRSVSDVVEAEFPSPFSDSRYRGFLLRHPKRSRDYSPAILQASGGGVERWGSSRTCQTPRSVKARRRRQGEASSSERGENVAAVIV